jgi:hypothetical protein
VSAIVFLKAVFILVAALVAWRVTKATERCVLTEIEYRREVAWREYQLRRVNAVIAQRNFEATVITRR